MPNRIRTVTDNPEKRTIEIQWDHGEPVTYHYVWLRHHGRLPYGMENDTSIKIDLIPDDPASLEIEKWTTTSESLVILWKNDDVETCHGLKSLHDSSYDTVSRSKKRIDPILWSSDSASQIPVFNFKELFKDNSNYKLLSSVRDYGLAKINNAPVQSQTVAKVAAIFGPVHINNYGRVFDVQTSKNTVLGSNTGSHLNPHTDESYRHSPPGISFFHCLKASDAGGHSILVDGFRAAQSLRDSDSEGFIALTTISVFFQRYAIHEEDMQAHGKIITTDLDGNVEGIRFTDRTLPPQDLPNELVEPVYRGIKLFWNIINSKKMKHQYAMKPGDIHIFDNHRVLHGRTAFDPVTSKRHLQQCSVNRDEFHNSLRLLAHKLGKTDAHCTMTGGARS
ncbi:MAG: TauD/TfdA family dioxygenase [bacterium]